MIIEYNKKFSKQFENLRKKEQKRVLETIELFKENPFAKKLKNHQLAGEYKDYRSISAGGDIRLHYQEDDEKIVIVFVSVGTHSQLYK